MIDVDASTATCPPAPRLDHAARRERTDNVLEGTGRTLTGGLDAATMHPPRQIFGAARKIEEAASSSAPR